MTTQLVHFYSIISVFEQLTRSQPKVARIGHEVEGPRTQDEG
jgi:hypothetical protein